MKIMCNSRQYYNQLKIKDYEEYLKRQNKYYLDKKKYYEEYLKRQNEYYLNKKKYDKEHHKSSNDVFANKRKCDKTNTSQSEFFNSFKTGNIKDNNINNDCIKSNNYGSSEIDIEENNLNYKKHDSTKNDNLEYTICTSIEDLCNEKFLEENQNELYKETNCRPMKKIYKKCYDDKLCNNTHGNQMDKCDIEICKTTVSSETLSLCENVPHTSDVTVGPVTVKIPVVLTECNIAITVQSSIKLKDAVLEIKHIRKNAYLNQCKLIPNSENDKPNTGILFLDGFIRKNVEYSTKDHTDKGVLCGKLKHITVNVPFKCTTRVTFNTLPKFKATTFKDEVEILQTNIKVCNPYEEGITGRDIREQNFRLIEFFNEKVFCELISTEFVESDILENPTNKECISPHKQIFHDITEKVVLFLTIKLLQNQNVVIPK